MVLKDVHEKLDEIPEPFRALYTEKGGKYELTGIAGVKTSADLERVQASLAKERNEHKATREKLGAWGELTPEEVLPKLEKLPELELAAKGKLDDAKIEEIATRRVEGVIRSRVGPLERTIKQLTDEKKELLGKLEESSKKERKRTIFDAVRTAAVALKVRPEAMADDEADVFLAAERMLEVTEDGRVVTKDRVGVTPGIDPVGWLTELQPKKGHWWPGSTGTGSKGSGPGGFGGGVNPWSHDGWNATEQGKYLKAHGTEKAKALAASVGVDLARPQRPQAPAKR